LSQITLVHVRSCSCSVLDPSAVQDLFAHRQDPHRRETEQKRNNDRTNRAQDSPQATIRVHPAACAAATLVGLIGRLVVTEDQQTGPNRGAATVAGLPSWNGDSQRPWCMWYLIFSILHTSAYPLIITGSLGPTMM
jgi:hypothetical protein